MLKAAVLALLAAAPAAAQEFFTLKGHGGPIMDVAVSASGDIATASFDNAVGDWGRDHAPRWLDGHRAAVNAVLFWEAEGLLLSGGDDNTLRWWDRTTGAGGEIGSHQAKIMALALDAASGVVASASWDGSIGLWRRLPGDGAPRFESRFLRGHQQGVNDVAFSDDGATLYSASTDGTIRSWDVATGSERRQIVRHGFGVNEMVLNEAEGWLAYGAVDGGTRMLAIGSWAELADFTLDRRPILAMAHDPVQHQLAVGDGEGYIMVIDTVSRRIVRDFRATRRGPVWALAFSPDGQNIHAGGIDDILYSWPVATMDAHGQMGTAQRSFLADPATMSNGERQFQRKCSICHTLTPSSARRAGPSLHGLFGRRAGTVPDYPYSDTLAGSAIVWTDATVDALFDIGPDHYIPGTKMPMQRIVRQQDRDDLIEYLRVRTKQQEN